MQGYGLLIQAQEVLLRPAVASKFSAERFQAAEGPEIEMDIFQLSVGWRTMN